MPALMTCGQLQLPGTADGSFGGLDVRDQAEAIEANRSSRQPCVSRRAYRAVPHRGVVIWSLIEKRLPSPQLDNVGHKNHPAFNETLKPRSEFISEKFGQKLGHIMN